MTQNLFFWQEDDRYGDELLLWEEEFPLIEEERGFFGQEDILRAIENAWHCGRQVGIQQTYLNTSFEEEKL